MRPPSLCGSFLTNKRSLVAFTWSLTTVLTLTAFLLAIVMTAHVHTHYMRMERYYNQLLEYNHEQRDNWNQNGCQQQQNNNDDDENNNEDDQDNQEDCQEQQQHGSSDDREIEWRLQVGHLSSRSMAFVALYTCLVALFLSLYGSTTIVGFTSMRGVYIAPCFSPSHTPGRQALKIGLFGGAVILFANVLLVCAIVLGEVRVEDWSYMIKDGDRNNNNNNEQQNQQSQPSEPYEIERIATILAVTCMFLAPLYIIFAVLLFFSYGEVSQSDMDPLSDLSSVERSHTGDPTNNNNFYALDQSAVVVEAPPQEYDAYHHHSSAAPISQLGSTLPRIGTDPRSMVSGHGPPPSSSQGASFLTAATSPPNAGSTTTTTTPAGLT